MRNEHAFFQFRKKGYKKEGVALTTPSLHPLLQDNANAIKIASIFITISEQNIIKKSQCQVNSAMLTLLQSS
ncbi:hypothetical protein LGMK_04700 [Leuconostoc sp. C2]|uniref:Uncharacterized protein n=2 Tax=Leuconostoc kimchii TaxID=136609 RepID=D5T492_LEUKI|nr:hypothetical protein LKI_07455 [Leuconostoc kimchii IMSNU 11154]AEJ30998.1 hypothetical protein LGMK_04700 [Leuconostoc sp. C2]QBR48094.1 hypothetical protein EW139_08120 [Leuconostoc kimchii]